MMKKNINKLFVFTFLVALITVSCEEFLDETPVSEIDVDFIYSTGEGLEVGVNALYNRYRRYNVPGGYDEAGNLRSNMFFMAADDLGQVRTYFTPYNEQHSPTGFWDYKWVTGYQLIDRCNAIIQAADNIEHETKDYSVAQAKAIRAEIYLDLIRMYDNILLDTTSTTPENIDDEVTYAPANPADVHALIESDLKFAIENLSYDEPYGRYSKATARHLLGKDYMWQGKWALAAAQFNAVIDESGKSLVPINEVFGQNLDHSEMLLTIRRDETLGTNDGLAGGGPSVFAAVWTNRLYEVVIGGTPLFLASVENGGTTLGWCVPNEYLQSLYDQDNDKRYTTYFYPEEYISNNPINNPRFGELITKEELLANDNYRQYHWSLKKLHDEESPVGLVDSWKDYPMYRLAETYLLGAEANWRNGNTSKALEYINTVRRRAYGVADATYDFTTFDLETYLEESARELSQERNRWFLLKRLGILVERQNLYYRFGANFNSTRENSYPMQAHWGTLPIPQTQIELMGTFPQNPGYPQ